MKKVLALSAGVLVALAPTGTAFAGEAVPVPGKAYGNCNHSSAGGNPHSGLLLPEHNPGNGGLAKLGKSSSCPAPVDASAPTGETPDLLPEPPPVEEEPDPVAPAPVLEKGAR